MTDVAKYEYDVAGWAKAFLGVDCHPGQVRFFNAVMARRSRWTAQYLTIMLASGNRAGKTMALAILILHSCFYKTNLQSTWPALDPEKAAKRKAKAEYHWYHFGIAHEVADLVYNEVVRFLSGVHPAQRDGLPIEMMRNFGDYSVKEYGDYRWVRFANGSELHFRTTGEKALGSLGKDMHGISFDEAGLERNLDFLIDEVFHLRRLGTGGQLIMVSTPSEDLGTAFPDRWLLGSPDNHQRQAINYSLRMSTRDNIGYGLTQEMFDLLIEDMDERTIRQNIDGEFLQARAAYFNGANVEACFHPELPERSPARAKLMYLQGVDPAKSQDSAWSIVLAVVNDPGRDPVLVGVRAEQKKGQKSTEDVVALVADAFNAYDVARLQSRCYTATDATGFGGKMFREALDREVPQVFNVEFGGTVQKKRKLLGDLRTVIDEGRLILPGTGLWQNVRRQLLGYKLEDRGIEQDAVMALVCAVWLLKRVPADGQLSVDFDLSGAV